MKNTRADLSDSHSFLHQPPRAAYVHIPFCLKKCDYCDFVSYAHAQAQMPAYFAALEEEIKRVAADVSDGSRPLLQSVYFGGGTPNCAPASSLLRILTLLDEHIGVATDAEITVEANPGLHRKAWLANLRAGGFNRLSVGFQTASPDLLRLLGRIHTPEDFGALMEAARASGWQNISADIMLGLPHQTAADVEQTLGVLMSERVTHVSLYSLIIEPNTPFAERYGSVPGADELPDDAFERRLYHRTLRYLRRHGFDHYEISNAARPGYASRHNLNYWNGCSYYGFGCGAHAFLQGRRYANETVLSTYIEHYQRPGSGLRRTCLEVIDREAAVKEFFLLGLRKLAGVSRGAFIARFGHDIPADIEAELLRLTAEGLLEADGQVFRLSRRGLDLANLVFMAFV